jgi:HTH-type transcriptional regulator / antitoxin HigA
VPGKEKMPSVSVHAATRTALQISNNKDYNKLMKKIDELMEIPDSRLTKKQASELHQLAVAAQRYERSIYNIKPPSTFEGVLEMKMYELKLNQSEMAKKLNVSNAKLSLILGGKQKPDIYFLKTVNENLGIDGNYLLSVL